MILLICVSLILLGWLIGIFTIGIRLIQMHEKKWYSYIFAIVWPFYIMGELLFNK